MKNQKPLPKIKYYILLLMSLAAPFAFASAAPTPPPKAPRALKAADFSCKGEIGAGAFGVVGIFEHKSTRIEVAIKRTKADPKFAHNAINREIPLLQDLAKRKHAHIVEYIGYFVDSGSICIVTELLSHNLYKLIEHTKFKGVSSNLTRRFAYQLLDALSYLESKRIIHCDLKPENVLLVHPRRTQIKIVDFGSSYHEELNTEMNRYIQSRFYRSPEVLLRLQPYGHPMDMWSLGCMLFELYTGNPIFPGKNEPHQYQLIISCLGPLPQSLSMKTEQAKLEYLNSSPELPTSFEDRLLLKTGENVSCIATLLDLLQGMLTWDPEDRISPEAARAHSFFIKGDGHTSRKRPRVSDENSTGPAAE